jgi:hypothetical protein
VRRRSEAVDPDALGVAGQPEGAVADQARAEERRGLEVRVAARQGEAEALVGDGERGEAAVAVVAGEARAVAQVLAARAAIATLSAGPAQPGHPHPLARGEALTGLDEAADDLVPRHERQLRPRELAVDDMQVGAADAAGGHLEKDLPGTGLGSGQIGRPEGGARCVEDHGAHARKATAAAARYEGPSASVGPQRRHMRDSEGPHSWPAGISAPPA